MKFTARWRPRIGPFQINTTNGRWTSTTLKIGRYSRNLTHGHSTFDTPGPGSVRWGGKGKRSRRSARSKADDDRPRRWPYVAAVLVLLALVVWLVGDFLIVPWVETQWDHVVQWWQDTATQGEGR